MSLVWGRHTTLSDATLLPLYLFTRHPAVQYTSQTMAFSTAFSRRGLSVRADANASKTATRRAPPRAGNVPGQFHVDTTCIDCDLCRRMAPETFTSNQGGSIVYQQPSTREGRVDALQALLSCPT